MFWDKEIEKQTKIATHMDLWGGSVKLFFNLQS
jgi:hypothetical protein